VSADHAYFVYTLASRSRTLYTGVTNNLERRILQHRQGEVPGFTAKYKICRLVHFELFADIRDAIRREKEIKGWRREKKVALIEALNPTWEDLSERLSSALSRKQQVPPPPERVRDDSRLTKNPSSGAMR
jgi:putative endonuclease